MLSISVALLASLVLFEFWKRFSRYKYLNFPKGPGYFPGLGHLPLLGSHPHLTLTRWKKKYGPIFAIQFGSFPTIVLNDVKVIKRCMLNHVLNGRPEIKYLDSATKNRAGFLHADGPLSDATRTFIQRQLKVLSSGTTMESRLQDLVPTLLKTIDEHAESGEPLEVFHFFLHSVISYLWGLLFGSDPQEERERINKMGISLFEALITPPAMIIGFYVPKLAELFPLIFDNTSKQLQSLDETCYKFIREVVEEHKASTIPGQPRDLVDALLQNPHDQDESHIIVSLFEMFIAGTETPSAYFEWALYFLVSFPETQQNLLAEIEREIGTTALPSLSHREGMPYTEAFIHELLRKGSVEPLTNVRSALEDSELEGYRVPKGTLIVYNLYCVHHDPKIWGDPQIFRPERFLTPDGKGLNDKVQDYLVFGGGKRKCIGENITRGQLFIYIVSMVQKFEFRAEGKMIKDDIGEFGFTVAPTKFSVGVKRR